MSTLYFDYVQQLQELPAQLRLDAGICAGSCGGWAAAAGAAAPCYAARAVGVLLRSLPSTA